jgi:hypothetical protein
VLNLGIFASETLSALKNYEVSTEVLKEKQISVYRLYTKRTNRKSGQLILIKKISNLNDESFIGQVPKMFQ